MARRSSAAKPRPGYLSTVSSALVVCLAVGVVLLGRIRLKNEEARVYAEISRTEREIDALRRGNRKLAMDYETLTAPSGLVARIREMRLDLAMPGEDARIVLPEPQAEPVLPAMVTALPEAPGARAALEPNARPAPRPGRQP